MVQGTLNSQANTTYRVEFFASPAADVSGYGEGQSFLGAKTDVTTDGSGNASFTVSLSAIVLAGRVITATATDPSGNTSEYSLATTVTATDPDGDGIPTDYENAHGMNPNSSDANADTDGDGFSNLAEFLAGTDPQNPANLPVPPIVSQSGQWANISIPTLAGRIYRLEFNDTLNAANWSALIDPIVGTGATIILADQGASGALRRFYRTVVLP